MVVYPVPGSWVDKVPQAPLEVSQAISKRLIRTGAFSTDKPPGEVREPIEWADEMGEKLDYYDSPVRHGAHYKTFKGGPPPDTAAERKEPGVTNPTPPTGTETEG